MAWINWLNWISLIRKYQQRNYPEKIRLQLNAKYKSLHKHEKKIKNISKNSCSYNCWCKLICKLFNKYQDISPKDLIRIKHHRYMINKIKREIDNIKKYYD